ncbi:MAG: hypothetical protein FJX59_09415 [Alphaproteobacteria bacterium]|nr:hypothetical protein [Alphaproteobacteria bacterium]
MLDLNQRSKSLSNWWTAGTMAAAVALLAASPAQAKTLGFVLTIWNIAQVETKFIDECPEGFNIGYDELWWRGLSKDDRAKYTDNGLRTRLDRYFNAIRRGPNKEDVCMNPTAVAAPPHLLVEGKQSYGLNLDGDTEGKAGANSCAHENFEGVDGTKGVDNQMYRLLGCVYGFRSYGQFEVNANENRKSNGNGMTLFEITNVDDVKNDPDVTVNIYRAIDPYTLDGAGQFTPWASYRIDAPDGKPRYKTTLKGRIENGVVLTEAGDSNVPFYGNYTYMNQLIRDMRVRLEISDDGASAKGMLAGYYDVDQLLFYVTGLGPIQSTAISDCPAIHNAAYKVADGYPDPNTGKCTSLSSAFNFKAVAAFIVHPKKEVESASAGK